MPSVAFGILSALSGPVLDVETGDAFHILDRSWIFLIWGWINLLLLCLNNQRQPDAIREDSLNKSWRPLPSQRMAAHQAYRLMLATFPVIYIISWHLDCTLQTLTLTLLNFSYNDWGGADHPVARNLINACGFICYASAALDIVAGSPRTFMQPTTLHWLAIIAAVVFSTIHIQDLRDQAGDRLRGRPTIPLLVGDALGRWTIVIPIAFWSLACPRYWQLGWSGYVLLVAIGVAIVGRTLWKRGVEDDRRTFKLWSAWLVAVYTLPLMKRWQWV